MYGALDDDTGRLSAHAHGLRTFKEFSTRPRTRKKNAHGCGGERAPNVIVPDCPIYRTMSWGFTHRTFEEQCFVREQQTVCRLIYFGKLL
eukprot:scaffold2657_cov368-Pavlova_lutheri.AAC.19